MKKGAIDLWLDEMMDQPIRQLIEADRLDFRMVMDYIGRQRRAKADDRRKAKGKKASGRAVMKKGGS